MLLIFYISEVKIMKEKTIGFMMILASFGVIVFMLVWTIILPIINPEFIFQAYLAIAIVVFIAVFIVMILVAWIGLTLLKTRAPDVFLEETTETHKED